jgi:CRISPR-associated exonuclease Cas4
MVLTVGDIKQFFYCARHLYFLYQMPHFRPTTYKMEEGKLRQKEEQTLEKRRTLHRFELKEGKKFYELRLFSERLGVSGMLDMAIITEKEAVPVDFKDGSMSLAYVAPLHHKYQLVVYGLLLEEAYRTHSFRGFIHSLEDGNTKESFFTNGAKTYALRMIERIRHMLLNESLPPPSRNWWRCRECEFRLVC